MGIRVMVRLGPYVPMVLAALTLTACGSTSKGTGSATTASTPGTSGSTARTVSSANTQAAATTTAGSSSLSAPNVVSGSAGEVSATMHVAGHHPRVNRSWPLSFVVTAAGAPARASVSYEYLFGGQVVARRSHYTFKGHFSDTFLWPGRAVGYPLTFRAVVVSGKATVNLDYAVQVVR
jgi:hypothetical protein